MNAFLGIKAATVNFGSGNVLDDIGIFQRSSPKPVAAAVMQILAILLAIPFLNATTVVALWTPEHVIIGVDGKLTWKTPQGVTTYDIGCKVLKRGAAVYVPAGIAASGQEFNLVASIDASGDAAHPKQIIASLRHRLETDLARIIPGIRKEEPSRYSQWLSGFPILTLCISWPDESVPALNVMGFFLDKDGQTVSSTEGFSAADGTHERPHVFYLTPQNGTDPIPNGWFKEDHLAVVRNGIDIGIREDSTSSGPPITIIQVSPKNTEWIERGKCSEDTNNAPR